MHDLAHGDRVGQRHDDDLRTLELNSIEVARVLGQALDDGHAARAQVAADLRISLDHDERETAPLECRSNETPDAAVAANHGVAARGTFGFDGCHGHEIGLAEGPAAVDRT